MHPAAVDLSNALVALVAGVAPSVVAVRSGRNRASGFVWKPGLVVTCEEALGEEAEISVVAAGGADHAATLVGRDPTTDVALLRVENLSAPPLTASAVPAMTGMLALAISAEGGAPRAVSGIVSAAGPPWRSLRGGDIDARVELDLRLHRGAAGAVAIAADGRCLGMSVPGPRRRVLVIPPSTYERVATMLERDGRVKRGYLGLGLHPVRLDGGGVGAMVMSVDKSGPGAAAGVHQGDVIVAWNGAAVQGVNALVRALGAGSVGTTAAATLRRAGADVAVSIVVAERPDA